MKEFGGCIYQCVCVCVCRRGYEISTVDLVDVLTSTEPPNQAEEDRYLDARYEEASKLMMRGV